MTRAEELADGIIMKHARVVELTTWLTTNDMAGLECAQTIEKEQLLVEIAAEGYLLAREIRPRERRATLPRRTRHRPPARAKPGKP